MTKKVKLQPATHERTCQVCATLYIYPEKGVTSTRHLCVECAGLNRPMVQILKRMNRRISNLERTVKKLSNNTSSPSNKEAST